MSNVITALTSLFDFFFSALSDFADFFTTNTLGQIVLGCILISLVSQVLLSVIRHIKG